jgi:dihydrodipicolinate synthase/N-acetylneuraminate lyase
MQPIKPGIYAAALTPMHADFSCDVQALAGHCLDLIERGCEGVVLFGAAGSICGIANLYPELIASLFRGKEGGASIFSALEKLPFIAAAKALMEAKKGAAWKTIRPPLEPLTIEQRRSLYSDLQ